MNEKKKHKIMLGIEVVLLCMIVAILGTNAASSNPPSNGVSYGKNNQTTVEGALNDLYTKANYGNASASQILKDKTALVGGKQVKGTMPLKNGSSQASKVSANANNVYMVFPYGYYPAENHFSTANSSEVYATNADVASAIGLTAGKLLKGQTVLGITGTGTTGVDTSDATATAADISSGKTAYVNGSKITGSMSNKGAVNATVAPGGTYTIPAGYHNGSGKVTASSCPTCATGINDDNSTRKTGKMTNGIEASIGDYYMISYNIGTLKVSSVTFDGCNVIVQDIASTSISGTTYRTTTVICKATSSKITVSNVPNNWTWYKLN